jgi:hypothetical protein
MGEVVFEQSHGGADWGRIQSEGKNAAVPTVGGPDVRSGYVSRLTGDLALNPLRLRLFV